MRNGYNKYTTYIVTSGQDPIIGVLKVAKNASKIKLSEIAENSKGGVAAGTLGRWFNGHTKRPQFATVAAAAGALGIDNLPITPAGRKELLSTFKE